MHEEICLSAEGAGLPCDQTEALHSRVGKYVKAIQQERELREMSLRIIKSAISVFEQFNDVRNNRSLAHDNELLAPTEARFIFDGMSAFLRFVKSLDRERFGA